MALQRINQELEDKLFRMVRPRPCAPPQHAQPRAPRSGTLVRTKGQATMPLPMELGQRPRFHPALTLRGWAVPPISAPNGRVLSSPQLSLSPRY